MSRSIYAQCPKCNELLEINPRDGKVIQHFESKKKKGSTDFLKDQMESLAEEANKREDIFSKAKDEKDKKMKQLDKLFGDETDKIKKKGKVEKPKNIFDLE